MRRLRFIVGTLLGVLVLVLGPGVSAAGGPGEGAVSGSSDDEGVEGDIEITDPGTPASTGGGGGGPICHYEDLKYTTQDEQRNEIRPEETRPGVWGWWVCDDGTQEFRFFPDEEPIDPVALARSVRMDPPGPDLRTNPPASARSLVNLETWFWAQGAGTLTAGTSLGPISVEVYAIPRHLVVDPGDGTGSFTCTDVAVAYDPARPASSQTTTCGHTYRRPGTFTATATLVYDVGFTSNVGVGGPLGTVEPSTSVTVTVRESQAVVTG